MQRPLIVSWKRKFIFFPRTYNNHYSDTFKAKRLFFKAKQFFFKAKEFFSKQNDFVFKPNRIFFKEIQFFLNQTIFFHSKKNFFCLTFLWIIFFFAEFVEKYFRNFIINNSNSKNNNCLLMSLNSFFDNKFRDWNQFSKFSFSIFIFSLIFQYWNYYLRFEKNILDL